MKNYLLSFSIDEIEKLDMLSNKNAKYLLFKSNRWIKSLRAGKILIRNCSKINDIVGLQKTEEKDKQFLIEKIISVVEKSPYAIETEKKPEIIIEIETIYRICRQVYQSLFVEVADTFI